MSKKKNKTYRTFEKSDIAIDDVDENEEQLIKNNQMSQSDIKLGLSFNQREPSTPRTMAPIKNMSIKKN